MPRLILLAMCLLASPAVFPVAADDAPERTEGMVRETVVAEQVLVDVRVLDAKGRPILDLEPGDLAVRVDGVPAEIASVEWVEGSLPELPPLPEDPAAPIWDGAEDGRLIVLFFQRDLIDSRLKGLVQMTRVVGDFVEGLRPEDRVALVVHDTHLRVYADFTDDHEHISELLASAVVKRTEVAAPEAGPPPSLMRHISPADAKDAAAADEGLLLLARALDEIWGSKTLLYVGWGLNRRLAGSHDVTREALGILLEGHVTMYSLDITDADYHSLEGPLFHAAMETGGFYLKTHVFSESAMERVSRAMEGHYVLSFVKPDLPAGRHTIKLSLEGRKGSAYYRRSYED